MTLRLTTGQVIVRCLVNQTVKLDGERSQFFAGRLGSFG